MVMAGAEYVEWYQKHQTHSFHVFDAIPLTLFQPLLWAVLPSAASTERHTYWFDLRWPDVPLGFCKHKWETNNMLCPDIFTHFSLILFVRGIECERLSCVHYAQGHLGSHGSPLMSLVSVFWKEFMPFNPNLAVFYIFGNDVTGVYGTTLSLHQWKYGQGSTATLFGGGLLYISQDLFIFSTLPEILHLHCENTMRL